LNVRCWMLDVRFLQGSRVEEVQRSRVEKIVSVKRGRVRGSDRGPAEPYGPLDLSLTHSLKSF